MKHPDIHRGESGHFLVVPREWPLEQIRQLPNVIDVVPYLDLATVLVRVSADLDEVEAQIARIVQEDE